MVRVLVVGSLVTDLAFRVPRRPGPGEVVQATAFGTYRGGKGYNQAIAAARLGAEVTMIGAVGDDEYGRAFLSALRAEGVDADRVVRLPGVSTSIAVPLVTPDGDVGFVQHPGANHQLLRAHSADLPDCDVLLLQGEIAPGAAEYAAVAIRNRGAHVLLNPAPTADVTTALLDAADVVLPNEVEARELVSRADGDDSSADAEGAALAVALRTARRAAVVTLGAAGAAFADRGDGSATTMPPPAVEAVDATAAGDAFCAAVAVRLAEDAELTEAVRFACAAGALTATVAGAEPALPSRADVLAVLSAA